MSNVKIKRVVDRDPKEVAPLLLRFEHAKLDPKVKENDLNEQFKGRVFKKLHSATSNILDGSSAATGDTTGNIVLLETESMSYVGSTNDPFKQGGSRMMHTYIGIKRKNMMKLFEVTPVTVFPIIANFNVADEEKDASDKLTLEERREAETSLVKAFGSKKKRLTHQNREKNRVTDMNESIQEAANDAKVTAVPDVIKDTFYLNLIPPCNRDAMHVTDVYRVSDILADEDLELLDSIAAQCLNATAADLAYLKESKTFSDYFFASVKWLQVRKKEPRNILSMKLVVYTELLIRLYKMGFKDFRKKFIDLPPEFPPELGLKALGEFTFVNAVGSRTRSDELKDKTACYIMVLVVLANNFLFDVELMSTVFQMHINKLLILLRSVGVTVNYVSSSKEYKALLKLPLASPKERTRAARKVK